MSWINTPWSIRRTVRKDIAEWAAFNSHRKQYALSRLERELLFAGEHPIRFCMSLFGLMFTSWTLGKLIPQEWLLPQWEGWQAGEQLSYFTTLWSVQATLAALVYPIVIAFVTVFLQRRPAAEAFVHLYILDSGALIAGLSSLALVVLMASQYLALPTYGASSLPAWVALDAGWFLLNAVLTTFFLYRTIDFLRPEVQLGVVRRYSINIALQREIERLYLYQVLAQAQREGWIPVPSSLDEKAPDGPKLLLHDMSFGDEAKQGTLNLRGEHRLHNVRLWLLRFVVTRWMSAAKKWPNTAEHLVGGRHNWPLLTFPFIPGKTYENVIPLAYVKNGPDLASWQRVFLQYSLVFRATKKERYGIRLGALLSELEADARDAALKQDVELFKRSYGALVELHEVLLGASLVKKDDGTIGSWAMLPDIEGWLDQPMHVKWADQYRSIFQAAIGNAIQEPEHVRRLCHLVQKLGGPLLRDSPVEVREQILKLPGLLMYLLGNWWTRRVEEQGAMDHGPYKSVILRPPQHRVYEEILQSFVSGWETARDVLVELPEGPDFDWKLAPDIAKIYASHLEKTCRMLLAAVSRGDRAAAEWLVDILTKWWGSHDYDTEPFSLYNKTKFLTIDQISSPWEEVHASLEIGESELRWDGGKISTIQRAVLMAALKNYWLDLRLLTVELLLWWGKSEKNPGTEESLSMYIASGLLSGREWKQGGTTSDLLNQLSAADYLLAKVRQYASSEYGSGYGSRLDAFVASVKEMRRPSMVSMRIYSFEGADDISSLQDLQLTILAALSGNDWAPSSALLKQIELWISKDYNKVDRLKGRVNELIKRIEDREEFPSKLLAALLKRINKEHEANDGLERTQIAIRSLLKHLEDRREQALENESIDPDRLIELAVYASRTGFRVETGEFPLQLFKSVKSTTEDLQDFRLKTQRVRKGELTKTEIDQRAVNEDEFWSETIAKHVGALVLSDVLSTLEIQDKPTPDAQTYWSVLKTEADKMSDSGRQPILILDNATRPDWVWDWQHATYEDRTPKPVDLNVRKIADQGDGYICNFNQIKVFKGPLPHGQSILLSQEIFETLEFKNYGANRYATASVEERVDSKLLVDLLMTISRRVKTGAGDAFRLRYSGSSDES